MSKLWTVTAVTLTIVLAACSAAYPEGATDSPRAGADDDAIVADDPAPEEDPEEPVADPEDPELEDSGVEPLDTGSGTVADPVVWDDVAPILTAACSGCHVGGGSSGGFNFDGGAADLVDVASAAGPPYVAPGDPDGSYLFHKVTGTQSAGSRMPLGGTLSADEQDLIELWILDGAL